MFTREKMIRPVIKDVITPASERKKKEEPKKLTPYHKAVLRVLHNRAIAAMTNNDEVREAHRIEAVRQENDLPLILRKHPATSAEIADAKKQRIRPRSVTYHLSELDKLRG